MEMLVREAAKVTPMIEPGAEQVLPPMGTFMQDIMNVIEELKPTRSLLERLKVLLKLA